MAIWPYGHVELGGLLTRGALELGPVTMPLRLVIENTPEDELAPMPARASNDFIEAALLTAKNSKAGTREAILADVCNILSCRPEDLKFLFSQQSVPTRNRPVLGLELPDYRMSLSDIYKEAAE